MSAFQAAIPDVWLGEDGNLRILLEIESGQIEGLFLANQLVLEDMFVQSANLLALERHGEQYGEARKVGTPSVGSLLFSGEGGVYIPIGTQVAYDPGSGLEPLYFVVTQDGNIPAPGFPSSPSVVVGIAGVLTGAYEYVVTFVTAQGETVASPESDLITVTAQQINLSNIPLGGPGTLFRNIYRMKNGSSVLNFVAQVADNIATTYTDNIPDASVTSQTPPDISTAERILLEAQSESPGTEYNAVPGSITDLVNVPDGITSVTNPEAFINGTDEEDIEAYRTRLLNFLRSPGSGSPLDLQNWAEEIDGVESATVFPNDNLGIATPGHATVRLSGPNGSAPLSSVIDEVSAYLASKDLANITLHVTTFTPVTLASAVTITVTPGFVLSDISQNIQNAIVDYIENVPVGGTVYISGIVDAVFGLLGVDDVIVTAPVANQTAAATAKFIPSTPTVS